MITAVVHGPKLFKSHFFRCESRHCVSYICAMLQKKVFHTKDDKTRFYSSFIQKVIDHLGLFTLLIFLYLLFYQKKIFLSAKAVSWLISYVFNMLFAIYLIELWERWKKHPDIMYSGKNLWKHWNSGLLKIMKKISATVRGYQGLVFLWVWKYRFFPIQLQECSWKFSLKKNNIYKVSRHNHLGATLLLVVSQLTSWFYKLA